MRGRALDRDLSAPPIDVTLPGRPVPRGRLHPSTQTLRAIYSIFADLGFQVYRSPEVEEEELNFGLLNMPPHHPARIAERAVSPQRRYHKTDARCVPRFLIEAPPAARGCPLDPGSPWYVGFERAEPCRQGRRSNTPTGRWGLQ